MITKTHFDHEAPPYEAAWTQSLNGLQQQIAAYETAQRSGDVRAIEEEAPKVALAMRQVGDSHTDPKVKAVWYKKAFKFLRSKAAARRAVLEEIEDGVIALIRLPFALTGGVICVAGHVVRGVGEAIVGVGEFIAGGENSKDSDKQSKSFSSKMRIAIYIMARSIGWHCYSCYLPFISLHHPPASTCYLFVEFVPCFYYYIHTVQ